MAALKVTGTKVCGRLISVPWLAVHDVGVDAVLHCHPCDGRAGLGAGADTLPLEPWAVEPPCTRWCGASLARHGLHDVHRAHYLWMSASFQCVFAGRLLTNTHLRGLLGG